MDTSLAQSNSQITGVTATMPDLKKTDKARAKWDRNARTYDLMHRFIENRWTIRWFARLWRSVQGPQVLELGVGTGKSFAFYPRGKNITAIDFSSKMLARAQRKAQKSRLPVTLKQMDIQKLEFADNSFDTVVASCVFCSVPDPVLGFQEVRRVLKPGGRLVLLEHMRHKNKVIGKAMDFLNTFTVGLSGPAINRRTLDNIRLAGMEIETEENLAFGIMKFIVVSPAKTVN